MPDVDPRLDTPDGDPRLDSLELLTELWRQQADMWSARVETVEGRAAAVATAAAALGTLIVSQAEALSGANTRATIAFWLLTFAAALSFFARVLPRGHWIAGAKELFSTTEQPREAIDNDALSRTEQPTEPGRWSRAIRKARTSSQQQVHTKLENLTKIGHNMGNGGSGAYIVRQEIHDFWQARAESSHSAHDAKAIVVSAAAASLACALVSLAFAAQSVLTA